MGFMKLLKGREKPPLLIDREMELYRHFRLLRKLGRGSYSTVYEAERLTDGQRYAVKITDLQSLTRDDQLAVVEEIRLLASLAHPCILTYYEAFSDHGQLCVVTELVGGGDLGTHIAKLRQAEAFLWERQVWAYFLQVALGVQYLHHNHVLHRDLKPQNIMLTSKDGAGLKIADLGVSAELARVFTKVMVGTPHYMAPEMWKHKAYSYSADIWALGCILHELCTLRPTWLDERTRTEEDVRRKVLSGRYAPIPSRYSPELASLVRAMLRSNPAERPTIDEILMLPEVRAQMRQLPPRVRELAAAADATAPPVKLRQSNSAAEISRLADLNCWLPPARYATGGGGVAELLCEGPACRPSGPGGSSQDAKNRAAGTQGVTAASSSGRSSPDESEREERLRRQSVQVGDVLHRHSGARQGGCATEGEVLPGLVHASPPRGAQSFSVANRSARNPQSLDLGHLSRLTPEGGSTAQGSKDVDGGVDGVSRAHDIERHSVMLGQVFHHDDEQRKLGQLPAHQAAEPFSSSPLEPFEFLATPRAEKARHAAAHLAPNPKSQHPQPARQPIPTPQQPHSARQAVVPSMPAVTSAATGSSRAVQKHGDVTKQKKKSHGRLWRFMYGDEHGGMHQDLFD